MSGERGRGVAVGAGGVGCRVGAGGNLSRGLGISSSSLKKEIGRIDSVGGSIVFEEETMGVTLGGVVGVRLGRG